MPLYRWLPNELTPVPRSSLAAEGLRERSDLQRLLRQQPAALGEELYVVAEEFGYWLDSRRRIDLLALDSSGTLVVIELKRTDDESFMDLQALRYAAMVANLTFDHLVDAHRKYLQDNHVDGDPLALIQDFLGTDADGDVTVLTARPRILLVASDFSTELTTSVLWLNEAGLDIRCIRSALYRSEDQVLLDLTQVVPLPEASDYLVRLGRRTTEQLGEVRRRNPLTKTVLVQHGLLVPGMELVFDERRLPAGWEWPDPALPRARISSSPDSSRNVVWMYDEQEYSLSNLTGVLRERYNLPVPAHAQFNGYSYWRRAIDADVSLWELAQRVTDTLAEDSIEL